MAVLPLTHAPVVDWLLDSDPAIRWQVMRDLTDQPPEPVANPTISGTPTVGSTLTCVNGGFRNNPVTTSIAWLRDGVVITGAATVWKPTFQKRSTSL